MSVYVCLREQNVEWRVTKICTNAIKFGKNAQNQYKPHRHTHMHRRTRNHSNNTIRFKGKSVRCRLLFFVLFYYYFSRDILHVCACVCVCRHLPFFIFIEKMHAYTSFAFGPFWSTAFIPEPYFFFIKVPTYFRCCCFNFIEIKMNIIVVFGMPYQFHIYKCLYCLPSIFISSV